MSNGKFWCWHNWQDVNYDATDTFGILRDKGFGYKMSVFLSLFTPTKKCTKCGKVK